MDIKSGCVFPSNAENSWGKFHFSSKPFVTASHASGYEGGCKHGFQRTLYIASHFSDIVFDTVDFPIRYDKDCCDSAVLRNRRVVESLSPADIDFQKFVSYFEINGSTSFSKWSRLYLWNRKKQCFTVFLKIHILPTKHDITEIQRCLVKIKQNY